MNVKYFPFVYLLYFPSLYIVSSLLVPEEQAGLAATFRAVTFFLISHLPPTSPVSSFLHMLQRVRIKQ
jgi:hypothetical protein